MPLAPATVSSAPVAIDAGTDALTDEELQALATTLPPVLEAALARAAAATGHALRRAGEARIVSCRLRAGPSPARTLYLARCRVKLSVDDVPLVAVEAEALRQTPTRAVPARSPQGAAAASRNPQLTLEDARIALEASIDAAARLLVAEPAPTTAATGAPAQAVVPRPTRAVLARERMARIESTRGPHEGSALRAALFDLRSAGSPEDAPRVTPFLAHPDADVRAAAAEALGELCEGSSAAALEATLADGASDGRLRATVVRALERIRACARLPRGP